MLNHYESLTKVILAGYLSLSLRGAATSKSGSREEADQKDNHFISLMKNNALEVQLIEIP